LETIVEFVSKIDGFVFAIALLKLECELIELQISKGFVSFDQVLYFIFF